MTCIVGIEAENRVLIGGDSAGVDGYLAQTIRADAKVFTKPPFVMGFTSSFRMGQLLRYNLSVAGQPRDMDDEQYMSSWFVDAVRTCLKNGGFAKVENGREEGGTFLVGYRGRIYLAYDDFQIGRSAVPYASVGCGADLALGALHAMQRYKITPKTSLIRALEAAQQFSAGVQGPFVFASEPVA